VKGRWVPSAISCHLANPTGSSYSSYHRVHATTVMEILSTPYSVFSFLSSESTSIANYFIILRKKHFYVYCVTHHLNMNEKVSSSRNPFACNLHLYFIENLLLLTSIQSNPLERTPLKPNYYCSHLLE
jgi:hypothetical protein